MSLPRFSCASSIVSTPYHYFNLDFKDAYDEFRDRYLEERGAITNSPNAKDPKAEENANGTAGENDEKG